MIGPHLVKFDTESLGDGSIGNIFGNEFFIRSIAIYGVPLELLFFDMRKLILVFLYELSTRLQKFKE
jgi:hypothetical protein